MYQIDNEKFGKFLSEIRKEKSMTQKELADRLFVSDKTVSKWERGNSMPNVDLLIPIADVFGITVTELLRGEKMKEDKLLNSDEIENLVKDSLELSVRESMQQRKKKWVLALLTSIGIMSAEALLMIAAGLPIKQMRDSLYIVLVILIFAVWLCLFAKDSLPEYYDKNKINVVSQGIFKIHMVGLAFNNGNWPHILNALRVFTLSTAVLFPVLCYGSILSGGIVLWNTVKAVFTVIWLIGLLIITYIIGKKYE